MLGAHFLSCSTRQHRYLLSQYNWFAIFSHPLQIDLHFHMLHLVRFWHLLYTRSIGLAFRLLRSCRVLLLLFECCGTDSAFQHSCLCQIANRATRFAFHNVLVLLQVGVLQSRRRSSWFTLTMVLSGRWLYPLVFKCLGSISRLQISSPSFLGESLYHHHAVHGAVADLLAV